MKRHLTELLIVLALLFVGFIWAITFAMLMACEHYIFGIIIGVIGLAGILTVTGCE